MSEAPDKNNVEALVLMGMTNQQLLEYCVGLPFTTVVENELLQRLENYILVYGDFLNVQTENEL